MPMPRNTTVQLYPTAPSKVSQNWSIEALGTVLKSLDKDKPPQPVYNWGQGLARVLKGGLKGYTAHLLENQAEEEGRQKNLTLVDALLDDKPQPTAGWAEGGSADPLQITRSPGALDQRQRMMSLLASGAIDREQLGRALLDKMGWGDGDAKYGLNPVRLIDKDGNVSLAQLSNEGGAPRIVPLPAGVQVAPEQTLKDLGTAWGVVGERGEIVGRIPKDKFGEAFESQSGKEVATKLGEWPEKLEKQRLALMDHEQEQSVAMDNIKIAIDLIENGAFPVTGWAGLLDAAPGTPQRELAKRLESVRAIIGFQALQRMRANSPTGGALGNVSNQENRLLQSVRGSLDNKLSSRALLYNLRRLQSIIQKSHELSRTALTRDFERYNELSADPRNWNKPIETNVPEEFKFGIDPYNENLGTELWQGPGSQATPGGSDLSDDDLIKQWSQ